MRQETPNPKLEAPRKLQEPSAKIQRISKSHAPAIGREGTGRTPTLGLWSLMFIWSLFLAAWSFGFDAFAAEPSPAQLQFFENRVRPVLAQNCYKCHSQQAEKVK